MQHGQLRIYSPGAGWVLVDGKFVRGNLRGRGGFWRNPPGESLLQGGQDDHMARVWTRELDQTWRVRILVKPA